VNQIHIFVIASDAKQSITQAGVTSRRRKMDCRVAFGSSQ